MAKTAADLTAGGTANLNTLGTVAKTLVNYDLAVSGPGIVQPASERPSVGAISPAHASEQSTAILAAGNLGANVHLDESGKKFKR